MDIEIPDNLNCAASEQFVFREIGVPKRISAILTEQAGRESWTEVAGVEPDGAFGPAFAVKITDSGEGFAFLIYGGRWGIRLRPETQPKPWSFGEPTQWGEAFKIYGSEKDIRYA